MNPLLLDTCALIWFSEGGLSKQGEIAIAAATTQKQPIYISPISALEVGMLVAKTRLRLPMMPKLWFERLISFPLIELAELSPGILASSSFLPGAPPRDPIDRVFATTAREFGFRLMTRDRVLLDYAKQGHILAIGC